MSDIQNDMTHTVQGFVAQITELARRAALDTLESAFTGGAGRTGNSRATVAPVVARLTRIGRPRNAIGAKRSAAALEVLSAKFVAFVEANPGLRIEQINKQLGTTTKDLALPIRKLIAERVISAKGRKRSTMYFPLRKAGRIRQAAA